MWGSQATGYPTFCYLRIASFVYDVPMTTPRRLLIVEDEPLVASLLREVLENAGFTVRTATSALEATQVARAFNPDVAVLDINLGTGTNGVDLAFILHNQFKGISLVLLTKHPDLRTAGFSETDVPAGCGFIRKDMISDSRRIVEAIENVIDQHTSEREDTDPARPLGNLTTAQIEVLRLVAQGFTDEEVARRRDTTVRSIERLLNGVYTELGIEIDGPINPRVEAVRRFIAAAGTPDRY